MVIVIGAMIKLYIIAKEVDRFFKRVFLPNSVDGPDTCMFLSCDKFLSSFRRTAVSGRSICRQIMICFSEV